jgi:hypothetical protein
LFEVLGEHGRTQLVRWLEAGISCGLLRASFDMDLTTMLLLGAYDRLVRTIVHASSKPKISFLVNSLHSLFVAGIGTKVALLAPDQAVHLSGSRTTRKKIGHVSTQTRASDGKPIPIRAQRVSREH